MARLKPAIIVYISQNKTIFKKGSTLTFVISHFSSESEKGYLSHKAPRRKIIFTADIACQQKCGQHSYPHFKVTIITSMPVAANPSFAALGGCRLVLEADLLPDPEAWCLCPPVLVACHPDPAASGTPPQEWGKADRCANYAGPF